MLNFEFYNPTRIIFGKGQIKALDTYLPKDKKIMITYGGGSIKKNGVYDQVIAALGNRPYVEFGGIEPNPRYETLIKAVALAKAEKTEYILAVGGGSVIDGTKFINLALRYDGEDAYKLLFDHQLNASITGLGKFASVLTLPATGSEMNSGAVISYQDGKYPFGHIENFPEFSILDPEVTYSLPPTQVANGIVDTFIHTCEQYVTYPVNAAFQDRTAEGILNTLIEIGEKTILNPTDYDLRANLVWAATMALNGVIGAGVPQDWATHAIGHQITALFGIDHGKTLAILQPAIWQIRKDKKKQKLLQYANRVWHITEGSEDEIIDQAIEKTRHFFESVGIKTHLSEYGVEKSDLSKIIHNLNQQNLTQLSETHDLTPALVEQILELAF